MESVVEREKQIGDFRIGTADCWGEDYKIEPLFDQKLEAMNSTYCYLLLRHLVTIPYRVPLPRLLFRTRLASRSASSCLHSESTLGPVDPAGSVPHLRCVRNWYELRFANDVHKFQADGGKHHDYVVYLLAVFLIY